MRITWSSSKSGRMKHLSTNTNQRPTRSIFAPRCSRCWGRPSTSGSISWCSNNVAGLNVARLNECRGMESRIAGARQTPLRTPLRAQVPWDTDNDNLTVALEQQGRLEPFGPLVMQKIVIPVLLHQFRNDYGNLALW